MIRYCRKYGMKSYTNISNTQRSQPSREMVHTSIVELKNTSTLQYPPVHLVRRWFCPPFRRQLVGIGISVIIPRAVGLWRMTSAYRGFAMSYYSQSVRTMRIGGATQQEHRSSVCDRWGAKLSERSSRRLRVWPEGVSKKTPLIVAF